MSVADELQKLQELYDAGVLDDEEFSAAKSRILHGRPAIPIFSGGFDEATVEQKTRLWGMLLHLSVFAGYIVPIAGIVAPIIIWQLKKDELPDMDQHGKNALNWWISHVIYIVISAILVVVLIGIPLLFLLGLVGVIFPIVAAIKANNGEVWKYPMSISFF